MWRTVTLDPDSFFCFWGAVLRIRGFVLVFHLRQWSIEWEFPDICINEWICSFCKYSRLGRICTDRRSWKFLVKQQTTNEKITINNVKIKNIPMNLSTSSNRSVIDERKTTRQFGKILTRRKEHSHQRNELFQKNFSSGRKQEIFFSFHFSISNRFTSIWNFYSTKTIFLLKNFFWKILFRCWNTNVLLNIFSNITMITNCSSPKETWTIQWNIIDFHRVHWKNFLVEILHEKHEIDRWQQKMLILFFDEFIFDLTQNFKRIRRVFWTNDWNDERSIRSNIRIILSHSILAEDESNGKYLEESRRRQLNLTELEDKILCKYLNCQSCRRRSIGRCWRQLGKNFSKFRWRWTDLTRNDNERSKPMEIFHFHPMK